MKEISEIWNKFKNELSFLYSPKEIDTLFFICMLHFLGMDKTKILTQQCVLLRQNQIYLLENALEKLKEHTPIEYITNSCNFMGLDFFVNPAVLIPRPETEELVELVVNYVPKTSSVTILDICTGSGCIAVSLKKLLPHITMIALDISQEAIDVAIKNSQKHNVEVEFIHEDILRVNHWRYKNKIDFIVSNPPYIPITEMRDIKNNVLLYEPHIALFVSDTEPLLFYEAIIKFSDTINCNIIFFEIHQTQGEALGNLAKKYNFFAEIKKDLWGKNRFAVLKKV
ncbi:MAG: peptide chain release factor N(5)-glutamine methyltransferase [Bacteroidales bacterium]